jgi:nitroreductase
VVSRRSIRKFQDQEIPVEDIEYFIKAATYAPSGCNSQCWKFIAIKDRGMIKKIENIVINKVDDILMEKAKELPQGYLASKRKMVSFFAKAPVVIAVFMTEARFYDETFISVLKEQGHDNKSIMDIFANYDILSIGAAIQNMLLAIHEKGYGACWMNEPAIAGKDINEVLGISLDKRFISLIPVGIPAYTPREKKIKSMDEVFSIV